MARPTLTTRTRAALVAATDALEDRTTRLLTLGVVLAVALFLHWSLADPRISWVAAPLSLLAGLAGGVRSALVVACAAAIGHLAVDLVAGVAPREIPGLVVRTLVLPALALAGTAAQQIERQRDRAMQRAISEDPVTGLLSVRSFYDELVRLRSEGQAFAILLADIRGMRVLNERYGHPTGTEAMRALAHVLRRSAGPSVLASRLGSDEVAIALVGEERARCRAIVDEVVKRLHAEQVTLPDGDVFEVHAAYGIARYPEDGDDEVAVLRAADRAKERAKAAGLDRVGLADGAID